MAQSKDLVPILKLLDDDSELVRNRVWGKLRENLPEWEIEIRAHLPGLSGNTGLQVRELLANQSKKSFREKWFYWKTIRPENEGLEIALSGLSQFLSGQGMDPQKEFWFHPQLKGKLDRLSEEFTDFSLAKGKEGPEALAHFLFMEKGLQGARVDYYKPAHSDLIQVLEKGSGLPISLACIFILVGKRVGLDIYGCDVPEHFLTRANFKGEEKIIDCFDQGRVIEKQKLIQLKRKYAPDFSKLIRIPASADSIIGRVLRNLINAYHLLGEEANSQFFWNLSDDLRSQLEVPYNSDII